MVLKTSHRDYHCSSHSLQQLLTFLRDQYITKYSVDQAAYTCFRHVLKTARSGY